MGEQMNATSRTIPCHTVEPSIRSPVCWLYTGPPSLSRVHQAAAHLQLLRMHHEVDIPGFKQGTAGAEERVCC